MHECPKERHIQQPPPISAAAQGHASLTGVRVTFRRRGQVQPVKGRCASWSREARGPLLGGSLAQPAGTGERTQPAKGSHDLPRAMRRPSARVAPEGGHRSQTVGGCRGGRGGAQCAESSTAEPREAPRQSHEERMVLGPSEGAADHRPQRLGGPTIASPSGGGSHRTIRTDPASISPQMFLVGAGRGAKAKDAHRDSRPRSSACHGANG